MRTYNLKLDKYNISNAMYRELLYFCRQYDDKKQRAAHARRVCAVSIDGLPHGTGVGDPTASRAAHAERLQRDVDLIDRTAQEAAGTLAPYLLRNVTRGIPYNCLGAPCGKNMFWNMRKRFFYLLAEKKDMI